MQFRTEISPKSWPFQVDHSWPIIQLGSCFSQHISEKLKRRLFHVAPNPFGTSYNPISLASQIDKLFSGKAYSQTDLSTSNKLHFSFDHYTAFSHPDADVALQQINEVLSKNQKMLDTHQSGLLLITLGTAHAWKHKETGCIVNNCHKLPGQLFDRIYIEPDKIEHQLKASFALLHQKAPKWKVLISVSPVRHLRDGLIENQKSKAALIVAAQRLVNQFQFVHYFPSYEIMMDDLRDYRFYESDMLHPNTQAIEYIWNYFSAGLFTSNSRQTQDQIVKLRQFFEHRPAHPEKEQHKQHRLIQLNKLDALRELYPNLNWQNFDVEDGI